MTSEMILKHIYLLLLLLDELREYSYLMVNLSFTPFPLRGEKGEVNSVY